MFSAHCLYVDRTMARRISALVVVAKAALVCEIAVSDVRTLHSGIAPEHDLDQVSLLGTGAKKFAARKRR
ncbi:hypothetical protein FHS83_001778 [Rhizomicrobium palustre]|uniref:Uncharacterized protein n=1 Tax=Rhizomicrobium palustre TaxID=189966 RepID=A0A846MZS7_9PROT|nr:hypothetical protein [Rhizomicrobium palustre]NIK88460.1 hypothetical protein [Rhizomicrobium palustre]